MNLKALRIATLTLLLALALVLSVPVASAQVECPPGLEGDDCTLVQTAAANTAASGTFTLSFTMNSAFDTMGMAVAQNIQGSGQVQLDEAGNVVAMSLIMPEASSEMPFMGASSGAAGFVLVDGVAYFGAGDSVDTLEWQSVPADQLNADLSFAGFSDAAAASDMTMATPDMPFENWARSDGQTSDGRPALLISGSLPESSFADMMNQATEGAEMMEGMEGMEELAMMFGGMDGTISASTEFFVDPNTQLLLETRTVSSMEMSMDMSAILGEEGMEGLGGEEGEEALEGMGDLFGDALGNIGGSSEMVATFSDFGAPVAISAPAESTPLVEPLLSSATNSFGGIPALLTDYFNAVAAENMAGGMFGDGGDFGFDMGMYFANCTADMGYTPVDAGALGAGTTEDTLVAGEAKLWTFDGTAGAVVNVAMSGDFDGYMELLDPNGEGLTSVDDTNGLMPVLSGYELPVDGTYTLVACGYSTFDEGPYTLEFSN